jgi:uncharacterized protein (DUF4415 family)
MNGISELHTKKLIKRNLRGAGAGYQTVIGEVLRKLTP